MNYMQKRVRLICIRIRQMRNRTRRHCSARWIYHTPQMLCRLIRIIWNRIVHGTVRQMHGGRNGAVQSRSIKKGKELYEKYVGKAGDTGETSPKTTSNRSTQSFGATQKKKTSQWRSGGWKRGRDYLINMLVLKHLIENSYTSICKRKKQKKDWHRNMQPQRRSSQRQPKYSLGLRPAQTEQTI